MSQLLKPIDSVFAKSVKVEFRNFNKLYQFENDKDTISFFKQRDEFVSFLERYTRILNENEPWLLKSGTTQNEIKAIRKSNQIFIDTYSKIEFGSMMGWPISANIRDKSLFETIRWYKENNPETRRKLKNKTKSLAHQIRWTNRHIIREHHEGPSYGTCACSRVGMGFLELGIVWCFSGRGCWVGDVNLFSSDGLFYKMC